MKHVELDGKEIEVSNVNGKYYVMDDRCGHMNALPSMGNVSNDITLQLVLSMEQDLMLPMERR